MKQKIMIFLLSFLVITIGIDCVSAENLITLDNIKTKLQKSEIMKKYNAKIKIETNTLFIETNNIVINFNYDYGTLSYYMDTNVALYAVDQSVMTEDEVLVKSKESMEIASEVVACVADLYGYTIYHNDWIGNMFLSDYANNGIYYKMDNVNKMAILYNLKLDLNGTFKAYLDKIGSYQQNSNQASNSNNGIQNIVDSTENNNQSADSNNNQNEVESEENNSQITTDFENNNTNDIEVSVEKEEKIFDEKYCIATFIIVCIMSVLLFWRKNSLQKI